MLFKIIPLPIQNEGRMIMVNITSEYLIYNFEIGSYHIMSESTLSQSQRWQQNKRICQAILATLVKYNHLSQIEFQTVYTK